MIARITDVKRTGYDNLPNACPVCKAAAGHCPLRVTLYDGEKDTDVYVHTDCYPKIREGCEVDSFAALFGA